MAHYSDLPKYIPGLAWYRPFEPFAYAIIRFSTGAVIAPHGIDRLFFSGTQADLGGFLSGLPASVVGAIELIGGIMLALGVLTRPVALLLGVEWLLIALAIPLKPGTNWFLLGATPHYAVFVATLCFALVLRGGGAYSFDRAFGKEF